MNFLNFKVNFPGLTEFNDSSQNPKLVFLLKGFHVWKKIYIPTDISIEYMVFFISILWTK